MEKLIQLDTYIFRWINNHHNTTLDQIMILLSDHTFWAISLFIYFAYMIYNRGKSYFRAIGIIIGLFICTDTICFRLLKQNIKRYRPCYELQDVRIQKKDCGGYFSFPSNHAANSATIVSSLLMFHKQKIYQVLILLAMAVGYSRIYLGVHYPSDILFGYLLGITIVILSFKLKGIISSKLTKKKTTS